MSLDKRAEDHHHHHGVMHTHGATRGPRLVASLLVTLAFVIGEAVAGAKGHSLALLSDAGHNASDALALGLAAYAVWIARKPANEQNTYGYHRVAILIAMFNSVSLVAIALVIFIQAWNLFRHPEPITANLMIWVASVSVLMNTVIAWALSGGAKTSLNMRAAFIHMSGDAASAAAVIIAGFVVKKTGWVYADPFVSILIAVFILYTAWGIIRDATNILLEGTPKGLDVNNMVEAMLGVSPVLSVHDVHAWTVSDGMNFMSCHVELPEASTIDEVSQTLKRLNELLARSFGIAHATIQAEVKGTCWSEGPGRPRFCEESSAEHYR